jgi:uncharacterized protein YbjT (DUF2867 family)
MSCSNCKCDSASNSQDQQKLLVSIVTANSNSGSACLNELMSKYDDKVCVRAVFRSEEKAKPTVDKYGQRVQVVTGVDASQPATLERAFVGAQSALIVTPFDPSRGMSDDSALTVNMINAAAQAGVKYIVLVASWTVKAPERIGQIAMRFVEAEKLLAKLGNEQGLRWTVLRGGYFMENLLHMLPASVKSESTVKLFNCHTPYVDTRDIGMSAAACLSTDGRAHDRKHYEMSGPELLTGEQVTQTLSKVLGKELKYVEMPRQALAHFPKPLADLMNYVLDEGKSAVPFGDDVRKLTGQAHTLEQFFRDHKNSFN